MNFGHWINADHAWTDLVDISRPGMESHYTGEGKAGYQYSIALNFAEFDFDWEDRSVTIRILGSDKNAPPAVSTKWSFDSLTGHDNDYQLLVKEQEFVDTFDSLTQHPIGASKDGEWVCINYRDSGPQWAHSFP